MIKNIIEIELGYINTNHPDFIDVISLVKTSNNDANKKDSNKMKSNEMDLSFESQSQNLDDEQSVEQLPQQSLFKFNKKKNNQKV